MASIGIGIGIDLEQKESIGIGIGLEQMPSIGIDHTCPKGGLGWVYPPPPNAKIFGLPPPNSSFLKKPG